MVKPSKVSHRVRLGKDGKLEVVWAGEAAKVSQITPEKLQREFISRRLFKK